MGGNPKRDIHHLRRVSQTKHLQARQVKPAAELPVYIWLTFDLSRFECERYARGEANQRGF